ncbi:BON domain-containing protein [Desulfurispora thermophila]|uniref:BON domain-containing protein n=1 Tax=Desulfurispora thermophila TaxID=265470 RepID=UPI00036FBC1E|nr:BON domain-containing protein [Desulfurispora thermophila]
MHKQKDKQLLERVQQLLDSDADIRAYGLNAEMSNDLLQITGIVDTLADKKKVDGLLARYGISTYRNDVTISTDGAINDRAVMFEVSEELSADPRVDLKHVGVKSIKGNVYLVGTVHDPDEERAAIEAASRARGVKNVISQLKVKPAGLDADDLEQIFHSQVNNDEEKGGVEISGGQA